MRESEGVNLGENKDTMMKQAIAAVIACMALTASVVAQECMICPGGSLRDYWILQIKVIRQIR